MERQKKRDGFTSQLGVVLAAAGSAIGIGNVWRFSYVVGVNGGGAFLLIYLLCILLVGLPLLLAELALGRNTGTSALPTFKKLAPKTLWWIPGALGVMIAILILCYYPLIAGWSLGYFFESIFHWQPMIADTAGFFNAYVSGHVKPLIMLFAMLTITAFTLVGGVAKGIERTNKILMPLFLALIVILIIRSLTLPGAEAGVAFLFKPDFSKITVDSFLEALGHGFYSLSVGMAIMITYGSYIRKDGDLVKTAVNVSILDTTTAIMSGLAIFPAVFALGLEPDSGAGLAFITLPKAFATLPGGQIFAALFFLLLTVAALSSISSLLQVVVAYFEDRWKVKNRKALLAVMILLLFAFGVPSSLSYNVLADFKIFGLTYFDLMDQLSANVIVPITGLLTALFVAFRYTKQTKGELMIGAKNPNHILIRLFPVLIRFVVPISIVLVFLQATGVLNLLFK